jgi:transposase
MKLQDVILKAIAKKWSYFEAAEIAGIGVSRLARMIQDYQRRGYTGISQYRAGRMVRHRLPFSELEQILALYPRQANKSVATFRSVLSRQHGIRVEQAWLQAVLAGAGMVQAVPPSRPRTATLGRRARENRLAFPDFYPKAVANSKTVTRRNA